MKLLAKAYPNQCYENIQSISDIIIEARLTDNNQINFYETHIKRPEWVVKISEETVKSLFPHSVSIKERPFLLKENKDFDIILNRNKKHYIEAFENLKLKIHATPSVHRKIKNLPENGIQNSKINGVHRKR
jgi:hypothetical protein